MALHGRFGGVKTAVVQYVTWNWLLIVRAILVPGYVKWLINDDRLNA